jgi:3-oxoacyl-[acyl-carrier protein] reductase
MQFKDKVVLITWASKWIWKETALEFAKEWAKVVVNYFSSERQATLVVDKIKQLWTEAIAIKCDVSEEIEVQKMVKEIVDTFGKIDILVNNAWVVFDVPFFDRTVEQFKRTLEVNLLWTFLCSKYVSEEMLKSDGGKIINISSTNAMESFSPEAMDYDASKAWIIILTRDLAKQLAPKFK